ncbi:MAG: hypothetical protein ACR652_16810 [Methylocystis sp.]|uniref:hypothetical protein n=1 Tax=Methylocystis sp. TaxID=1911079 RepID=UPI003DA38AB4
MKTFQRAVLLSLAASAALAGFGAAPAAAFTHEGHGTGCFVTTSPTHNTKGVRHWRSPCPHHERKHLNPYHPGHHRPDVPHPAPH